jgi:WD40 repeat protein
LPTVAEYILPSGYGFGFAVNDRVFTRLIEPDADGRQGIEIWCLANGTRHVVRPRHEGSLQRIAFSPDGALLATTAWDGRIKLHEVEAGRELATLSGELRGFTCVVFSPDGRRLVAGGFGGYVTIWDVETHQIVARWQPFAHWCARLTFHDGDQTLIALGDIFDVNGHWSGTLKRFSVPPLAMIDALPGVLSDSP